MTRYARAGSTKRHTKVPGEATKWGEFDLQKSSSSTKVQKGTEGKQKSKKSTSIFSKSENSNFGETSTKSQNSDQTTSLPESSVKNTSSEQTITSPKTRKKNKKKGKFGDNSKPALPNAEHTNVSGKAFEKKKEMYLKKLQAKRTKNGILLLPSKVERKLYIIKKKLREKGLPPHVLKEIIRKERRKEELKFRKTFNPSKLCFNCRQPGHVLADCPQTIGPTKQETGMCFKCGSNEHTSFKCPKKVQGFPFANCFICKEQGHISKDCPQNKHGIYPKGGKCSLCGNVNHLKKNCPTLSKKEADDSTITLHTINEITSIDDEIIEGKKTKKQHVKKPKLVKF